MRTKIFSFLFLLTIPVSAAMGQWSEQSSPIPFTLFSISAVSENVVWTSASGANILRTTNGGTTWENAGTNVPAPMGVEPCIYAFDANTAIYSCYAGVPSVAYVYKTTNAGASWSLVFTQGGDAYIWGIYFKNASTGMMVGEPIGGRWSLWKSTNSGNNWDSTGMYLPESDPQVWTFENSLFYLSSNIWFGARGRGIYHSTNDGANWVLQDLSFGGFPYPSAIYFQDANTGFTSANLNIVKTTNGGTNWTVTPGSSGSEVIRGITGTGNQWWYVRFLSNQIFYTSNGGNSWSAQYTAPVNIGYNHMAMARNGSTIWAVRIDGGISVYYPPSGIKQISSEIPGSFRLHQNYPNPFNPSTKISFSIPLLRGVPGADAPMVRGGRGVLVRLCVYNSLGQEIEILVNEQLSPGTYETEWNASAYTSGVYYYKLIAGDYSETRKMIFMK